MVIFSEIKEQVKTTEGIQNMSKEEMYYAWKWFEEGNLILSSEAEGELASQMCLVGM